MQRRQSLGADSALSGPSISSSEATTDGSTAGNDNGEGTNEEADYGHTTVVDTPGELELFTDDDYETQVSVSSHLEGVGLTLLNEIGQMITKQPAEATDVIVDEVRQELDTYLQTG